jgi:hypothetical protein
MQRTFLGLCARFSPSGSLFSCIARRSFAFAKLGAPLRKKVTTVDLKKFKEQRKPITMVTAYTYPSAVHVDVAGIDVLLVGDSVAMVCAGCGEDNDLANLIINPSYIPSGRAWL